MYEMAKISAETYAKNCVQLCLWVKMIDTQKSLDVENRYYLVRKEIHGSYETNNPTE